MRLKNAGGKKTRSSRIPSLGVKEKKNSFSLDAQRIHGLVSGRYPLSIRIPCLPDEHNETRLAGGPQRAPGGRSGWSCLSFLAGKHEFKESLRFRGKSHSVMWPQVQIVGIRGVAGQDQWAELGGQVTREYNILEPYPQGILFFKFRLSASGFFHRLISL